MIKEKQDRTLRSLGLRCYATTLEIDMNKNESWGDGTELPNLHPDLEINQNILISELCAKLDTARQALNRALEMNVVTPAALAMKSHIRWALAETHPKTINEQHPNCG
jgi:hypothetical protein